MSRRTSPSTHRPEGIARVLRVWDLPRSTFYARRERRAQPATRRRGRTPTVDDAALLVQIRAVIAESPFHGEGHRKIWSRLRALKGVRTSIRGARAVCASQRRYGTSPSRLSCRGDSKNTPCGLIF